MSRKVINPGGHYPDGAPVTKPVIEGAPMVGGFTLLPAKPETCPECAVVHNPADPHNKQSLYYQYHFYAEHEQRWPTWEDAMAHCSDEVKAVWRQELKEAGAIIE